MNVTRILSHERALKQADAEMTSYHVLFKSYRSLVGTAYCLSDEYGFFRHLHVVSANDVRAFQDGGGDGGERAVQTFLDRSRVALIIGKCATDEGFSRSSYQHGKVREGGDDLIQFGY
jgi:hypothetical protein